MKSAGKILVIRPDHIGDMILTIPFLKELRNLYPDSEITILCGKWSKPILKNNPYFDTLFECNFPWLAREHQASWKDFILGIFDLRKTRYDLIFNLRKAAKTAVVTWILKGKKKFGFDLKKCSWAHSHKIHYRTDIHISDLYLNFLNLPDNQLNTHIPELFFSEEEIKIFHSSVKVPANSVVIAPGAGFTEKCWYPERWSEIIKALTREWDRPIVMIGSASEKNMVKKILDPLLNRGLVSRSLVRNYCGKLSLRESALVIKNASLLLCVDSAAMHIASSQKTPVISLFGPTNPQHWGSYPNGQNNQIICKTKNFTLGRGSHNKSGGMEKISVDEVLEKLRKILPASIS